MYPAKIKRARKNIHGKWENKNLIPRVLYRMIIFFKVLKIKNKGVLFSHKRQNHQLVRKRSNQHKLIREKIKSTYI